MPSMLNQQPDDFSVLSFAAAQARDSKAKLVRLRDIRCDQDLPDDTGHQHGMRRIQIINDRYPGATNRPGQLQTERDWDVIATSIGKNASIGSDAVILCGIPIGEGSMMGAGSAATKRFKPYHVVAGNPARVLRVITKK